MQRIERIQYTSQYLIILARATAFLLPDSDNAALVVDVRLGLSFSMSCTPDVSSCTSPLTFDLVLSGLST